MDEEDLGGVDLHAMFEAKMGFSASEVPMDDDQVEKFLLLCQQANLEAEGLMGEEEEEADVKVIKVHSSGDLMGAMDDILKKGY